MLTAGLGGTLAGLLGRITVSDQPAAAAEGCATVGKRCRRAIQCCSGLCTGKHGKKKCRGHGAGTCTPDQDICTDSTPDLDKCNNNLNCICSRTTAGTSFCAFGVTEIGAAAPSACGTPTASRSGSRPGRPVSWLTPAAAQASARAARPATRRAPQRRPPSRCGLTFDSSAASRSNGRSNIIGSCRFGRSSVARARETGIR